MTALEASLQSAYRRLCDSMQAQDWASAEELCRAITRQFPRFAEGWHASSHVALALQRVPQALTAIERALSLESTNALYWIQKAKVLLMLGRAREASEAATQAERTANLSGQLWDSIGSLFSLANCHEKALAAYEKALELAPDSPRFRFNRATTRRFLGDLEGAQADYDRVIALRPRDYEAYKNRSDLRRQTPERNHIAELTGLLGAGIADAQGEVQIRYALAKEYEDVGEFSKSFASLELGARLRRRHLRYDVRRDVDTVTWIKQAFSPGVPLPPADTSRSDVTPIFIVGLPRSGTTLVERIIGSHPAVTSAGESNNFAFAVVGAVQRKLGVADVPREQLVAQSAHVDFPRLGEDYLARMRANCAFERHFIDKTPLNYLYCGLIHRALPDAKIVHVYRHPAASCYAIHKTLFKNGYPFAYDLAELARYYVAYSALMRHWHDTLPGVIHDLAYERLVTDPAGESRRLLQFCGLDWHDDCARFYENPAPSTTASASQVRSPIYRTSVDQWMHYKDQLAPLLEVLATSGIAV